MVTEVGKGVHCEGWTLRCPDRCYVGAVTAAGAPRRSARSAGSAIIDVRARNQAYFLFALNATRAAPVLTLGKTGLSFGETCSQPRPACSPWMRPARPDRTGPARLPRTHRWPDAP